MAERIEWTERVRVATRGVLPRPAHRPPLPPMFTPNDNLPGPEKSPPRKRLAEIPGFVFAIHCLGCERTLKFAPDPNELGIVVLGWVQTTGGRPVCMLEVVCACGQQARLDGEALGWT